MNDNINSRYRQLEMPMRKGNPVITQHRKAERLTIVIRHAVDSFSLRKLERSLRRVVRGSDRGGGMRNDGTGQHNEL